MALERKGGPGCGTRKERGDTRKERGGTRKEGGCGTRKEWGPRMWYPMGRWTGDVALDEK